jgi:hypothetical protein
MAKMANETKTVAAKNFEANLDEISTFIKRMRSEDVLRAMKALERAVKKEVASIPNINAKKLERATAAHTNAIQKWVEFMYPACRWMSVMLVSFLQSYLEEGLIDIAARNPSIVKGIDIQSSSVFEIETIEELRNEVRLSWAQSALRPGGPMTWRKKLRELGAPKIDDSVVRQLQHLWDTRNIIVHSQSVASAAYAKKYAHMGSKAGQKVKVTLGTFQNWLGPTKAFSDWADDFFLAYGKTSSAKEASKKTI